MTRPLRSAPITGVSPLLRAGPPARLATVLTPGVTPGYSLSPPNHYAAHSDSTSSVETRFPTFPARAADQAHAASMPDTTWPETGTPARPCSRSSPHGYGFDVAPHYDDTSTAVRGYSSSWSPPDTSWVPFPHRSPRRSSANAACGGLKPPPNRRLRRANLHLLQNIESR
jgi:hypothetical protein